jgi:hypothetical protein
MLLLALGRFSIFSSLYTVGTTFWPVDKHRENTLIEEFIPRVGFEHMTSAFERVMSAHASDRIATVTGQSHHKARQVVTTGLRLRCLLHSGS